MPINLTSPCCLLLGLADIGGAAHQLGLALSYPPVQLAAQPSSLLLITGGRADLAYGQAERFLAAHGLPPQGEIEIELAVPSHMGLGSAGMLGLSVARALAELHGLPAELAALAQALGLRPEQALERQAFAQGGLLLVAPDGSLARRHAFAPADDERDWIWVLVLPRVRPGIPNTLEDDRRAALRAAARHLSAESGALLAGELWPAAERDDIAAFGQALEQFQQLNYDALRLSGQPHALSADETRALNIMRAGGAVACGRAIGGMALYALVRGGPASRTLRRALTDDLGYFGGTVMASLAAAHGATLA